MVSFNTTVRQMTKIFQWPKCLSRNDQNVSTKKKNRTCLKKNWHGEYCWSHLQ